VSEAELQIADWRRQIAELYAAVRAEPDPAAAHERWRSGRDRLFRGHPQSPLTSDDPMRQTGVPYWPYDPSMRVLADLLAAAPEDRSVDTATDGVIRMRRVGRVAPAGLGIELDVWWLSQYGGGMFVPVRDGTAGSQSYGGGRYLLDTAKGADLGTAGGKVVLDFNFLYHPSCRYNPRWECPLAPAGNTTAVPIAAGERM
jgi:hypothetical protein